MVKTLDRQLGRSRFRERNKRTVFGLSEKQRNKSYRKKNSFFTFSNDW